MPTTEININRLNHLLALYNMPKADLLQRLNEGRSRLLTDQDIFSDSIKLSILKKIDGFFKKGLAYYVDPTNPVQSREESIFFRKDRFNASLNLGAKQVVNQFEEEKLSFSALAKLSDFNLKRQLPVFKVSDAPHTASAAARDALYPTKPVADDKKFLERLITGFAENNILVFEFVEHHNLLEKPNINGFYLAPNVIVLKRQKSFKREIFTLAHELGHYLLNEEEIDEKANGEERGDSNLNTIEKWCNEFAYCFLAGRVDDEITKLESAGPTNDYHHEIIQKVSTGTHLSQLALFTRLLAIKKIKQTDYSKVYHNIVQNIRQKEEDEKARQDVERKRLLAEGKPSIALPPKPIISPLYLTTLKSALFGGNISEADFCKKLHIKPDKIDKYLQ